MRLRLRLGIRSYSGLSNEVGNVCNCTDAHVSHAHVPTAHISHAHVPPAHVIHAHVSHAHVPHAHVSHAHVSPARDLRVDPSSMHGEGHPCRKSASAVQMRWVMHACGRALGERMLAEER